MDFACFLYLLVLKADQGKKRANDSALKTPVSTKKAKNITPEKTGETNNLCCFRFYHYILCCLFC